MPPPLLQLSLLVHPMYRYNWCTLVFPNSTSIVFPNLQAVKNPNFFSEAVKVSNLTFLVWYVKYIRLFFLKENAKTGHKCPFDNSEKVIAHCLYSCRRSHWKTVSKEGRELWGQGWGQPWSPHLPNPVSINHSQHTTNTRALRCDWFYFRPMEAAETTIWGFWHQLGSYTAVPGDPDQY